MANDYENGIRDEAIKRIDETVKKIWEKLDDLPCADRQAQIAATRRTATIQWWLIGVILAAIFALAIEAIRK